MWVFAKKSWKDYRIRMRKPKKPGVAHQMPVNHVEDETGIMVRVPRANIVSPIDLSDMVTNTVKFKRMLLTWKKKITRI